jgi:hypothetical protein
MTKFKYLFISSLSKIKCILKKLMHLSFFCINKLKSLLMFSSKHQVISNSSCHTFCGYYDVVPIDGSEEKLLALQVDTSLCTPDGKTIAKVGYYNLTSPNVEFIQFGTTRSWNWQQGSRLQWISNGIGNEVIYNTFNNNQFGAVIQNVDSGSIVKKINFPIYEIEKSGRFALTLNFSRLQRLRPGYGYNNLPDKTANDMQPNDDGIWLVDLQNNRSVLRKTLKEIATYRPHPSMVGAQHYINHLSLNPSGTVYMFFHLWMDQNNRRYSRLFTSETDGNGLFLINNFGPVSHYTWLDDESIVVTTNISNNQYRYIVYHYKDGFKEIIGDNHLLLDGHPTYKSETNVIITDTYPNFLCEQKLLQYDISLRKLRILDRLYIPPSFHGEFRCDLHPRISPTGRNIIIDVVKKNKRSIKIIKDIK